MTLVVDLRRSAYKIWMRVQLVILSGDGGVHEPKLSFWKWVWVCSRLQQGADQPELLRSSLAADHTLPPPLVKRSCCEEIQVEVNTPGILSTLLSISLFLCTSFLLFTVSINNYWILWYLYSCFFFTFFRYRPYTTRLTSILANYQCLCCTYILCISIYRLDNTHLRCVYTIFEAPFSVSSLLFPILYLSFFLHIWIALEDEHTTFCYLAEQHIFPRWRVKPSQSNQVISPTSFSITSQTEREKWNNSISFTIS